MGYFDKFKHDGIPFMDGREKGDMKDVLEQPLHIIDFGFIKGKRGDFGVVAFKEYPENFYFVNAIITDMLRTVQVDGMEDELAYQAVTFYMKTSKDGNEYMTFEF